MKSEDPKLLTSKLFRLPINAVRYLYRLPRTIHHLQKDVRLLNHSLQEHRNSTQAAKDHADGIEAKYGHAIDRLDVRINDIVHRLAVIGDHLKTSPATGSSPSTASKSNLLADDHLLDSLYVEFEKWFRGSPAEIKKQQQVYLPYFKKSTIDSKKTPVVDIGCGRGEFLELLGENDIRAIGLDLNKAMVQQAKDRGQEAVQGDALSYLRKQKSGSLMAVTGFHIVEHIPFTDLVHIVDETYRSLTKGGLLVFETPNPENLIVGSCNFYADPSHLRPIPPAFLEFVLKTRGFNKVEILRLAPIKNKNQVRSRDPLVREMAERMFGPQNYAVIGHK